MPVKYTPNQRTQLFLLLERLLSAHQGASPFTLLIDSLEQSAKPLIREYVRRAKAAKTNVIFISFQTLSPPPGTTHFLRAHKLPFPEVQKKINSLKDPAIPTLLIIDTLHPLIHHTLCDPTLSLPDLLTPLLGTRTALLATFHASVPVPVAEGSYQPSPRALLLFIATAIITLSPLSQTIAAAQAAARALPPPPARGLDEGVPGVLVGRGAQAGAVLLDVELRRKSGRAVAARFVMERPDNSVVDEKTGGAEPKFVLLEEHPAYRAAVASEDGGKGKADASAAGDGGWAGSTFELGLTEKQRRDREGVVLPYFDAQKGYAAGEPGEGGRILYQMGQEDMGDFDDEEDEI